MKCCRLGAFAAFFNRNASKQTQAELLCPSRRRGRWCGSEAPSRCVGVEKRGLLSVALFFGDCVRRNGRLHSPLDFLALSLREDFYRTNPRTNFEVTIRGKSQ